MQENTARFEWFNQARFGMFIHWGLYALLGRGEWVRYQEDIPSAEYRKLADRFAPSRYDAAAWARLARDAGMRYMVLTTKHHDGFCLFDSRHTGFTSVKTASRRDLVAEYVDACRSAGLGVGLYFSVKDWSIPAYFHGPENDPEGWKEVVQRFHDQTVELMSNYGAIDVLFYDCADDANFRGGWGATTAELWRSAELNAMVRKQQPGILINDRSGLPEDYGTPEQEIPANDRARGRVDQVCMTMNDTWGYAKGDDHWKSTQTLLHQLISCAARGNNYLLNVGPDPDGVIPPPSAERLRAMGGWLAIYGEAVYGTERVLPNWWDYTSVGRITTRGTTAYAMIQSWDGRGEIVLVQLANPVVSATLMGDGRKLAVRREGRRVVVSGLPAEAPSPLVNVVKLELEGAPRAQYYY